MSEPLYLRDREKFETSLVQFLHWAEVWHRGSGGYLASDTMLLMMRMESYVGDIIDRNPRHECWRRDLEWTESELLGACREIDRMDDDEQQKLVDAAFASYLGILEATKKMPKAMRELLDKAKLNVSVKEESGRGDGGGTDVGGDERGRLAESVAMDGLG